jgi:hypothetical protein
VSGPLPTGPAAIGPVSVGSFGVTRLPRIVFGAGRISELPG